MTGSGGSNAWRRERRWPLTQLLSRVGKRLEKRHQIFDVLFRQSQGSDYGIEITSLFAALIVKLYHLFERTHAAVMHVRPRQLQAAKRRSLEPASIGLLLSHLVAAQVGRRL